MSCKIAASLMCANLLRLEEDIVLLKNAGVDYLHFDIMDGGFVPNITLGPDIVNAVRNITGIPFDIHLMVWRPENYLALFDIRQGDIVSVHREATVHLQRTLQMIRGAGAKPAVALNPSTPIYAIEDVLDDVDAVVIMSVNPGFAGQKLVPAAIPKISRLKQFLSGRRRGDIEIEVDGNVSFENAVKMRAAGADIFVAGSSSVFLRGSDIYSATQKLRECIK